MARIRAEELAKYVENNMNYQKVILRNKGVKVEDNKPLQYYVNKINDLPNSENGEYIPDPYFAKMEEEWKNDPLRVENGGSYFNCSYFFYISRFDTTYIVSLTSGITASTPGLLKTSDGQEIVRTSASSFTIDWSTGHYAGVLKDGTKVKWIKFYTDYRFGPSVSDVIPPGIPSSNDTTDKTIIAVFHGTKVNTKFNLPTTVGATTQNSPLRYIVLDNSDSLLELNGLKNCYNLEYIKPLSQQLRLKAQSQVLSFYLRQFNYPIVEYRLPSLTATSAYVAYNKLEKLDLSNVTGLSGGYIGIFKSLQTLILPSSCPGFGYLEVENNLDTLQLPIFTDNSITCKLMLYNTKFIDIPFDFSNSLDLRNCYSLTKTCILDIFNKVKDLTDSTSKNLIFDNTLYAQLLDEEIAIVQNKNWTVTFV